MVAMPISDMVPCPACGALYTRARGLYRQIAGNTASLIWKQVAGTIDRPCSAAGMEMPYPYEEVFYTDLVNAGLCPGCSPSAISRWLRCDMLFIGDPDYEARAGEDPDTVYARRYRGVMRSAASMSRMALNRFYVQHAKRSPEFGAEARASGVNEYGHAPAAWDTGLSTGDVFMCLSGCGRALRFFPCIHHSCAECVSKRGGSFRDSSPNDDMRACRECGKQFLPPKRPGRPPVRCAECR